MNRKMSLCIIRYLGSFFGLYLLSHYQDTYALIWWFRDNGILVVSVALASSSITGITTAELPY
jgi:hypothetical protein